MIGFDKMAFERTGFGGRKDQLCAIRPVAYKKWKDSFWYFCQKIVVLFVITHKNHLFLCDITQEYGVIYFFIFSK